MNISITGQAETEHRSTKSGLQGVLKEHNFDLYFSAHHQYNKTQRGRREREREIHLFRTLQTASQNPMSLAY